MFNLSSDEYKVLEFISKEINVAPWKLWALIKFESNWDPKAKNPNSSARGLIQFTDLTARSLGYASSLNLVNNYPTKISQLYYPVRKYLNRYKPYPDDKSLFLSVFYPDYRYKPLTKAFPYIVRKNNPGIVYVSDYMNHVYKKMFQIAFPYIIYSLIGITAIKKIFGR